MLLVLFRVTLAAPKIGQFVDISRLSVVRYSTRTLPIVLSTTLHFAFCILHSAFCILHSAFCILHSALFFAKLRQHALRRFGVEKSDGKPFGALTPLLVDKLHALSGYLA